MKIGAIITGDIVDSTKMMPDERSHMLRLLKSLPEMLYSLSKIELEVFRGDSFQARIFDVSESLDVALAIRACIRSNVFAEYKQQWDARISLGIGQLDYQHSTLATSDGEAYRLSGRGLDEIGSNRLSIRTPWTEVNNELRVSTAFADNIVSNWSQSQGKIFFQYYRERGTHEEVGNYLDISRQMVDKALKTGSKDLINLYINRFKQLIDERIG